MSKAGKGGKSPNWKPGEVKAMRKRLDMLRAQEKKRAQDGTSNT